MRNDDPQRDIVHGDMYFDGTTPSVTYLPEPAKRQYDDDGQPIVRLTTCGECGRTWDDALITSMTPTPAGRCPFEDEHEGDE